MSASSAPLKISLRTGCLGPEQEPRSASTPEAAILMVSSLSFKYIRRRGPRWHGQYMHCGKIWSSGSSASEFEAALSVSRCYHSVICDKSFHWTICFKSFAINKSN